MADVFLDLFQDFLSLGVVIRNLDFTFAA